MIGYYVAEKYYAYTSINTNTTTSTCTVRTNVTVASTDVWVSSYTTTNDAPPQYRRPKPPFVPFEPMRPPRYSAPPTPCAWPVALRRFRGNGV